MARKPKKRAPYLMVSPPTWELARAAYLGGQTAAEVAARFNIGLQNLRQNIYKHGWSKRALADARAGVQTDAAAGLPSPPDPATPATPAGADLLEAVLARARTALTSGRGAEASALLRAAREYVLVQQDVADARAAIAPGVELWEAAQPGRAGAVTETLMVQTLHSLWSRLSIEEQAARADPDGSAGLKAWVEAQAAAAAGSPKPGR